MRAVKDFPARVDGPLGPWFKKVREAVSQVQPGTPRAAVLEALGPPDAIGHNAQGAGGQLQELMENVAGGETLIRYGDKEPFTEVLLYRDPYRPRRWYAFGAREGVVDAAWQESVSTA